MVWRGVGRIGVKTMLLRADLGKTAVNWRSVRCKENAPTDMGGEI